MKFIQEEFDETGKIAELLRDIDRLDAENANRISDEMFQQQPFFLTVLLGYRFDVTELELEETMLIFFLIWEYFKKFKTIPVKKITRGYFEKIQGKNVQMLKYAEGELSRVDKLKIYEDDGQNLKSNPLLTAIYYRFHNRPVLLRMDTGKQGILLIGIRSFIECFETIK